MAGVISPPGSKYGHWANDNLPRSPDEWFSGATAEGRGGRFGTNG
jgi:polyhydroxyalkanoate synthase